MSTYRLAGWELAGGFVPGVLPPVALPAPTGTARAALEGVLREALVAPPCVVAFSGGRDSSALLALAVSVARREGLPLPYAAVLAYPGSATAEETHWQDRVLGHLGVEAERLDARASSDLLGTGAQEVMAALGPTWPPLAHVRLPLLRLAAGGSLVVGTGGDEVLGAQRITPVVGVWRRRRRPDLQVLRALGFALAPAPVRARILVRADRGRRAWLTPTAAGEFSRLLARDAAARPLSWAADVQRHRRLRALVVGLETQDAVAALAGSRYVVPFLHPGFLAALVREGAPRGWVTRTEAMTHLVGDLLPRDVLGRTSKARFNDGVMGPAARDFAAGWTGGGVPDDLVDPVALRQEWLSASPSAASLPLLQHSWWATSA